MKRLFISLLFGLLLPLAATASIFDTIMQRVARREYLWLTAPRSIQPKFTLIMPAADGSYPDLNYGDKKELVNWQPIFHLTRLEQLAIAYACPESPRRGDPALRQAVVRGLEYWQKAHPICKNWWWNQIGDPIALGRLLIVMRMGADPLPAELEARVTARWAAEGGDPAKWTGANKTDIALHWIYLACLTRDEQRLAKAVSEGYQPIAITQKEGLQNDYSYHQHGAQLYIGGYGDVFLYDAAAIATLVRGTSYAIDTPRLTLLRRFADEGWLPTMRGGMRLYNTLGRSFTRMGGVELADSASNIVGMLRDIDSPARRPHYDTIVARMLGSLPAGASVQPYHRHYWRSDFTLCQRPAFTADVRLRSRKSLTLENGNGENLRGYFLSDGSMALAVRGDEYAGLFPVWHWARIPGVTAPDLDSIPPYPGWGYYGTSRFAGGVSTGLRGATGYAYNDTTARVQTSARKGWFFFDDAVVCLGADIDSRSDVPVATTLNQCRLRGLLGGRLGGRSWRAGAEGTVNATLNAQPGDYVSHDGLCYYLPTGGQVALTAGSQTGSWHDINNSMPGGEVSREVFTLRLLHGVRPAGAGYAYVVMPAEQFKPRRAAQYRILQNTAAAQIVRQGRNGAAGVVAFEAGTYRVDDVELTVSAPCALWLEPGRGGLTLWLADPSRDLGELTITLNAPRMGRHTVHARLNPTPHTYAGRSISAQVSPNAPATIEIIANDQAE